MNVEKTKVMQCRVNLGSVKILVNGHVMFVVKPSDQTQLFVDHVRSGYIRDVVA